jgi:hypothetical protein
LAELFPHLFAVHDHVDQTMFLEKFSSLKSFRQILGRSLSNNARTGKANHALRFSNDDVAQEAKLAMTPAVVGLVRTEM